MESLEIIYESWEGIAATVGAVLGTILLLWRKFRAREPKNPGPRDN